jgi:hypothetical protein
MDKNEKAFVYKILNKKGDKVIIHPLAIISGSTNYTRFLSSIPAKERKHIKFFLTHKQALDPEVNQLTLRQAIKKYGIKLEFSY